MTAPANNIVHKMFYTNKRGFYNQWIFHEIEPMYRQTVRLTKVIEINVIKYNCQMVFGVFCLNDFRIMKSEYFCITLFNQIWIKMSNIKRFLSYLSLFYMYFMKYHTWYIWITSRYSYTLNMLGYRYIRFRKTICLGY